MRQDHARREVGTPEFGSLVVGVFGAPVAWSLHLLVSYLLVALACTTGWTGVGITLGVVTVVLAAAALASGVVAYRRWRRVRPAPTWDEALADRYGNSGFLWIIGMVMAGLFAVIIILAGLPPLFAPMCA